MIVIEELRASFYSNNPGDVDRFILYRNSLHPNMRITMEHDVIDRLAFLDLMLIKDRSNDKLQINVYTMSSDSGVFTHFTKLCALPF